MTSAAPPAPAGPGLAPDDLGSWRHLLRATPTLMRVATAGMVAYRAELLIWFLTASLPVVMMLVWDRVAEEAPVGRFDQASMAFYFLAVLVVRQLGGSWVIWELNHAIRTGALSPALLRPINPLVVYGADSVAEKPMRVVLLVPLVLAVWAWRPEMTLPVGPGGLALAVVSLALGWLLNLLVQVAFGCLAFFFTQSLGLFGVWFGLWALLSGYLFPLELLPGGLRALVHWLPFRATLGVPVEILTGGLRGADAWAGVALQVAWVVVAWAVAAFAWRRGVRHHEAVGA